MDKNNKIKKRSIKRNNHRLKDPKKRKKIGLNLLLSSYEYCNFNIYCWYYYAITHC